MRNLVPLMVRHFNYDIKELHRMNSKLQRKINLLRMFTDHKKFNYQRPHMTYDKESGNVTIIDPADEAIPDKVIDNVDEVFQMKQQLYDELGLDERGMPKDEGELKEENIPKLAEKLKQSRTANREGIDYDPTQFYVFSRDLMRVDVGLMI